ncbi:DUF1129 family protein [Metabacillus herbersteinensis]|uniref:DUF1129 family protein n=1 Tax=Metabacillus herbersteinensis TaxID=283816 RepID=A0ABV6G9X6_9BACI
MSNAELLIEENNQKRPLLNAANEKVYGDFLLYIRTDLRVAELEGEEVLMDLLNHLLEGQEEGKTAKDLFGNEPQIYADELIASLPSEKKRKVIPFVISNLFNTIGWSSLLFGCIYLVLLNFIEVKETIYIGNLMVISTAIGIMIAFGIRIIFLLIRSTLFVTKVNQKHAYWKVGLFGGGSFAVILLLTWLLPEFGPELKVVWWVYLIIGGAFILMSKVIGSRNSK